MADQKIPFDFTDVAHLLRTPLTILKTQASMANAGEKSERAFNDLISSVDEQSNYMAEVLEDVSKLITANNNNLPEASDDVSMKEVISEVLAKVEDLSKKHNIDLTFDVSDDIIHTSKDNLISAITHLVDNAIRYGDDGHKVHVNADKKGIEVTDDGWGLSQTLQELVTAFTRGALPDDSEKRPGLGLSVIDALAKKYGWDLQYHPNENAGSKFKLNIS